MSDGDLRTLAETTAAKTWLLPDGTTRTLAAGVLRLLARVAELEEERDRLRSAWQLVWAVWCADADYGVPARLNRALAEFTTKITPPEDANDARADR